MKLMRFILKKITAWKGAFLPLLISSWLAANILFVINSRIPALSLAFVRQIPLDSFLGLWLALFAGMGICSSLLFRKRWNPAIPLALALIYSAIFVVKETTIL